MYSAGNGPAMRAPIIGLYLLNRPELITEFVIASTRITHTDTKACTGALAIARLTALASELNINETFPFNEVMKILYACAENDSEWFSIVDKINSSYQNGNSVEEFANILGLSRGVSGYIYHTVPVAIYAWMFHFRDFRLTLDSVLNLGGDTDTVGAITGALAGATVGESAIPQELINKICDWPISVSVLREVATALAIKTPGVSVEKVSYAYPLLTLRNLLFLVVVLLHGLRRLLPPY